MAGRPKRAAPPVPAAVAPTLRTRRGEGGGSRKRRRGSGSSSRAGAGAPMAGRRRGGDHAPRRSETPVADVLAAMIPSMLTSAALEEFKAVNQGWLKVALGALLGLLLWLVLRWRAGAAPRVVESLRRRWLAAQALVSSLAVAVMLAARIVTGRPTTATAVASLIVLAVVFVAALSGRRLAGSAGIATAGGVLGLCLGVLVLP